MIPITKRLPKSNESISIFAIPYGGSTTLKFGLLVKNRVFMVSNNAYSVQSEFYVFIISFSMSLIISINTQVKIINFDTLLLVQVRQRSTFCHFQLAYISFTSWLMTKNGCRISFTEHKFQFSDFLNIKGSFFLLDKMSNFKCRVTILNVKNILLNRYHR